MQNLFKCKGFVLTPLAHESIFGEKEICICVDIMFFGVRTGTATRSHVLALWRGVPQYTKQANART